MPRPLLALALVCHVAFATAYAWTTPSFEGPDENSHYEYAQHVANAGQLPLAPGLVAARGLPQTEGAVLAHHPPLYYALLATGLVLTGTDDTVFGPLLNGKFGDAASAARHLRFLHGGGEPGLLLGLRLLSVLLGALSIVCVHRLGRACCAQQPRVADLAALLVACLPMWSFLHGVLNSDVLATALSCAVLAVLVPAAAAERFSIRRGLVLGALLGLALLTKLTTLFLVPLAAVVLVSVALRTVAVPAAAITFGSMLAIAGWWFVHNAVVYGDPLALAAHDAAFQPIPPEYRWPFFRDTFVHDVLTSVLGRFGWFSLPPPPVLVWIGAGATIAAVVGLVRAQRERDGRHAVRPLWLLVLACSLVFAGTAHFNWKAPQPQARLLFPAIGPAAVLLAAGLVRLSASWRWRRWLVPVLPATALLVFVAWFRPAFAPELAPAPPDHRPLVGAITGEPSNPAIAWREPWPASPADAPPALHWTEANAAGGARYTLYAYDRHGRVWLATHEWSHGALVLQGGDGVMHDAAWQMLPRDVELWLKLRRVPSSRGDDPALLPASPPLPFRRR